MEKLGHEEPDRPSDHRRPTLHAARVVAKEIAAIAYRSTVTELRNKAAFERDVDLIIDSDSSFEIVNIDMDGLKNINDTSGHQAGNKALRSLGDNLSIESGEQDTVYHFSGDEFYVVTRTLDKNYVEEFISRARSREGPEFSYGVARWPDEGSRWEGVENLADERMPMNKRQRKERGEAPERPQ